ncbi:hypothetical protein AFLA_011552 [Aspergillus flavus NRRL3357]|nr:hypothetical protein AFLA_011552 [Aspergillus flavus NRRL3357]
MKSFRVIFLSPISEPLRHSPLNLLDSTVQLVALQRAVNVPGQSVLAVTLSGPYLPRGFRRLPLVTSFYTPLVFNFAHTADNATC